MGIANQTPKPAFLCAKERGEPANLLYPPADQPFDICRQDRWLSAIFAVRDAFNHSRSAQSAIKPHHEREPNLAMQPHPRQVNISCHSYGFELISNTESEYSPIEGAVRKRNPREQIGRHPQSKIRTGTRPPLRKPPAQSRRDDIFHILTAQCSTANQEVILGRRGTLKPGSWRRFGEKTRDGR
jgi:hypothetical protein